MAAISHRREKGARTFSTMPDSAVRLLSVVKNYDRQRAVDNLSLEVPAGSIYGFIGPNGSGKTTTLRLILHLILPDQGIVEVLGERGTRAANDRIGYLPEERGLYKKMTVQRQIGYFGRLKGVSGPLIRKRTEYWLDRLGLADRIGAKTESLSKGMRQKVQFITAVIMKPDILILDEPFSGLDPLNLETIRKEILQLKREGTTILLSTHDMTAAENMCDNIFMIDGGKKVLDGPLSKIQENFGQDTIRVRLRGNEFNSWETLPGVSAVRDQGRYQELRFKGDSGEIIEQLSRLGVVEHFEIVQPSLHDIFLRLAAGDKPPEKESEPSDE